MLAFLLLGSITIGLQGCAHETEKKTNAQPTTQPIKNASRTKIDIIKKRIDKGNALVTDGLYREALSEYRLVLRENKKHPVANKMVGIILVKTGDYKNAIRRLERASKLLTEDFDINFYLGEAYRTQDRYGDAIFRYKLALNNKPKSVNTLKALSWSYYKIRYYKASLDTASKLVKMKPKDVQANIILARVLNKLNKSQKALSILRRSAQKSDKDQRPYLLSVMGDVLYSMGQLETAANTYKNALKEQPLLAGALLGLAKITLERDQRVDLAVSLLERAGRIRPNLVEVFFYLGKAHQENKPKLSKKYLRKFRKLANGDPEYGKQISEAKEIIKGLRKPIR